MKNIECSQDFAAKTFFYDQNIILNPIVISWHSSFQSLTIADVFQYSSVKIVQWIEKYP